MGNIHDLQRRGVRIRSLADNEQSWVQYLDADPESPESILGYTLAGFAPWVSDPGTGVHPTPRQGGFGEGEGGRQETGAPRRLFEEQEAAVTDMVASGVSQRRVASSFGISPATVRRAVRRECASASCARHGVMRGVFQGYVVSSGVDRGRGTWWRW